VPPDEGYVPPTPELGRSCLRLEVQQKLERKPDGSAHAPVPVLEDTFLAVDSPPVRLPPGTLVRVRHVPEGFLLEVEDPAAGGSP